MLKYDYIIQINEQVVFKGGFLVKREGMENEDRFYQREISRVYMKLNIRFEIYKFVGNGN